MNGRIIARGRLPEITLFLFLLFFGVMVPLARAVEPKVLYQQAISSYPIPILLPAQIGGNRYSFILDTGASIDVFDQSLAGLLGFRVSNEKVDSTSGQLNMTFYEQPQVRIGDYELPGKHAGAADMAFFRLGLGMDVRGMAGAESFQHAVIELDFDHGVMRVLDHLEAPPEGFKSQEIQFMKDGLSPAITLPLGGEQVKFCLDSGSNGLITLNPETFSKMVACGVIKENPDSEHSGATLSLAGERKDRNGVFQSGELLGIPLKGAKVGDGEIINHLGMAMLVNFNLVIDLQGARLFYQKRNAEPPLRVNAMLGVVLLFPEGNCVAYQLKPGGGPAQDAGVRQGDSILRLRNLKEGTLNAQSLYDLCLHHAGEEVEIEFQHPGETKTHTAKLKLDAKTFEFPADSNP